MVAQLFLIQSHKDSRHLQRLVRVLRTGVPDSFVLVSHDRAAAPLPSDFAAGDGAVAIVAGSGGRGDFAILDGYLAALAWLRKQGIAYDWLTNLSGSDYPVYPLARFAAELAAARHDGFLHHYDALTADRAAMSPYAWPVGEGAERYLFQYRKLSEQPGKWQRRFLAPFRIFASRAGLPFRINTAYGLMLGRRSGWTPFNAGFRPYAGSYWHTIRKSCADHLLDMAQNQEALTEYYRHVLVPDEAFIQTVLVNRVDFKFVNDNRRYFDMSASRRGHPRLLAAGDLPMLTGGRHVFARKLEPSAGTAVFDALDAIALGPGA